MKKEVLEEVYVPEEQVVYTDFNMSKKIAIMKKVQANLVRKFVVADLDRDKSLNDFLKVNYAHAIGILEGKGSYEGVNSRDETWMYEYENGDETKQGGVAVVQDSKVVDFYKVWRAKI